MALDIEMNLKEIHHKVSLAAQKANRKMQDIQLIAVTKTVEPEVIEEAISFGVTDVGENKVQELVRKYEIIGEKVKWHMIGHLQKNKVKYIIDKVTLIHSLDSYDLAVEINKRAQKIQKVIHCLLQVNISGEESKYGIDPNEAEELLHKISKLKNVKIMGLMTMAPYTEEPEEVRKFFKMLKELSLDISRKNIENIDMTYLSMGMSNDFEIAVEEGANLIRIGSKIFGERNYQI